MSQEYDIDCRMAVLLRKMAEGTATDMDRGELHTLQRKRVELMTPVFKGRRPL